ncbi:malate dehydrogenase [bacterium]|nr:malate dehydrogenase [bacterium]
MKKVSIVGSGNVGVNSAFFIAETAAANVLLVDIQEGISTGKALDLMEAAPIRRYRTRIEGSDAIADIAGSEVVVLAAGLIRAPGKERSEHFQANAALARELATAIAKQAPEAKVIVATEPVDAIVKVVVETTGFDRHRVIGVGGILDSMRMASFIADALGVSPRDIHALVIGSHTGRMVPLPFYARVNGVEISQLLDAQTVGRIVDDTRRAGDVIVDLAKHANAYYAPSAAITTLVEAICLDLKVVRSVSVLLAGEYGLSDVALSVPCKLGAAGVEQIIELALNEEDRQALAASAGPVRALFAPAEDRKGTR